MKSFTLNDVQLTNDDRYLFAQGNWYRSHEKLGAHPIVCNGCSGFYFAVWAPGVKSVRVDGDFNGWGETQNYLEHKGSCLLYTSPSPRDRTRSRMPSSA